MSIELWEIAKLCVAVVGVSSAVGLGVVILGAAIGVARREMLEKGEKSGAQDTDNEN